MSDSHLDQVQEGANQALSQVPYFAELAQNGLRVLADDISQITQLKAQCQAGLSKEAAADIDVCLASQQKLYDLVSSTVESTTARLERELGSDSAGGANTDRSLTWSEAHAGAEREHFQHSLNKKTVRYTLMGRSNIATSEHTDIKIYIENEGLAKVALAANIEIEKIQNAIKRVLSGGEFNVKVFKQPDDGEVASSKQKETRENQFSQFSQQLRGLSSRLLSHRESLQKIYIKHFYSSISGFVKDENKLLLFDLLKKFEPLMCRVESLLQGYMGDSTLARDAYFEQKAHEVKVAKASVQEVVKLITNFDKQEIDFKENFLKISDENERDILVRDIFNIQHQLNKAKKNLGDEFRKVERQFNAPMGSIASIDDIDLVVESSWFNLNVRTESYATKDKRMEMVKEIKEATDFNLMVSYSGSVKLFYDHNSIVRHFFNRDPVYKAGEYLQEHLRNYCSDKSSDVKMGVLNEMCNILASLNHGFASVLKLEIYNRDLKIRTAGPEEFAIVLTVSIDSIKVLLANIDRLSHLLEENPSTQFPLSNIEALNLTVELKNARLELEIIARENLFPLLEEANPAIAELYLEYQQGDVQQSP